MTASDGAKWEDVMDEQKRPTPGEVGVISALIQRWPEVTMNEIQRRFRDDAADRREEALSMLREYLLVRAVNFLDFRHPERDRAATAEQLLAELDGGLLREPRAAFRVWVRAMVRWVYRDWQRRRRQTGEAFEVHVQPDGDRDAVGISFDKLEAEGAEDDPTAEVDDRDEARDIVAELMAMVSPDLQHDMAVFLAAEVSGDPKRVCTAQGTSMNGLMARLSRLRPHVATARAAVGAWGG